MKYLAVIEFLDKNGRGAVHYHMVCNLPYVPQKELAALWGKGFIYVTAIDQVDNVGAYVTAYMTQDMDDKRLQGLKAYNCSQGLTRPKVLKSWVSEDEDYIRRVCEVVEKVSPSYFREYESENAGRVEYLQYNFSREGVRSQSQVFHR